MANGDVQRISVEARHDCEGFGKAELILLCTKLGDFSSAFDRIEVAVGQGTGILTLQNGVEAPEIVARRFPGASVIASRVHGFFELSEHTVRHVGVTPSIIFGHTHGPDCGAVEHLDTLLRGAGIAGAASPDIIRELWQKFALASAFGGVGAATGLAAGAMRKDADAWRLLEAAIREVCDLALHKGIALPPDYPGHILHFVASFPPDATTTLQRDLEARRPSEYASLTGAVIRTAQEIGHKIPAFRRIEAMIRARGLFADCQGSD